MSSVYFALGSKIERLSQRGQAGILSAMPVNLSQGVTDGVQMDQQNRN